MIERAALIAAARAQIGVPWVHQQALAGVAVDCLGLIAVAAALCGSAEGQRFIDEPRFRNYGPQPLPAQLLAGCDELMDAIPTAAALPGDVYVMRFREEPQHFGFLAASELDGVTPTLIHTWAARGRVVEHGIDKAWRRRIVLAYRIRGVGPWPA